MNGTLQICKWLDSAYGLETLVFRLWSVFGPRETIIPRASSIQQLVVLLRRAVYCTRRAIKPGKRWIRGALQQSV